MTLVKFYLYTALFFLVITLIGFGLIIFGIFIILTYNQPTIVAMYTTIAGIILLPLGSIFTIALFYQSFSKRKQEKQQDYFSQEK